MWDSLTHNTPMVRIFIRPKIVLFLSLIALFFLLINWSKEPELLKAHVTLKEVKRVVLFPKGETVKGLRYLIIRDFSDLLNDRMPPACLRIQEHDDTFDDDFDIPIHLKLDEGVRVKAKLPATQQEVAACGPKTYPSPNSGNSTFAFHPVKPNIPYRLWSPVYGGSYLLQRGPNNVVNCKGELGGYRNFNETVVTSKSTGKHYAFIFKENAGPGAKQYALTVETETKIVAKEIQNPKDFTRNMKFIPYYFWSFTLLKSVNYSNLYLGCDSTGKARLVPMKSTNYPDARALFIFNKEVLDNFRVTSKSIYPHK